MTPPLRTRCAFRVQPLPPGFSLGAAVCSYGFAMLAPNDWRPLAGKMASKPGVASAKAKAARRQRRAALAPREGELHRPLRRSDGKRVLQVCIRQPTRRALEVRIPSTEAPLNPADVAAVRAQVERMLRLDATGNATARCFTKREGADLAARGPVGRLFRSPDFFEDLLKTFTLCNCGWTRTISMNEALCRVVGSGAFPTPAEIAAVTPRLLRAKCGVGYRAERIHRLARAVSRGEMDLNVIEAASDAASARTHCTSIFGLGPFGVANALQLLGHYEDIPADSETARHLRQARGLRGVTLENVRDRAARVYSVYSPVQFLRYWTELWRTYEDRLGGVRCCDAEPENYRLLTAAHMAVRRQRYAAPPPKRPVLRAPAGVKRRKVE